MDDLRSAPAAGGGKFFAKIWALSGWRGVWGRRFSGILEPENRGGVLSVVTVRAQG
jgi:hypothetical protein